MGGPELGRRREEHGMVKVEPFLPTARKQQPKADLDAVLRWEMPETQKEMTAVKCGRQDVRYA